MSLSSLLGARTAFIYIYTCICVSVTVTIVIGTIIVSTMTTITTIKSIIVVTYNS